MLDYLNQLQPDL